MAAGAWLMSEKAILHPIMNIINNPTNFIKYLIMLSPKGRWRDSNPQNLWFTKPALYQFSYTGLNLSYLKSIALLGVWFKIELFINTVNFTT